MVDSTVAKTKRSPNDSSAQVLNAEAAKLSGVADTLREIMESSGQAANIVGLLADVVDSINERISDVASQIEQRKRHWGKAAA